MKKIMQFTVALLVACLFSVPAAMAQSPSPGTSFTDRIENPDFDAGNGDGWEITGTTPGWVQQLAQIWNRTFDMSQEIPNLPAGAYKLTVDGLYREGANDGGAKYNAGTEVINAVVYAQTESEYKETPLHSLYSVTQFTGSTQMLNGYVDGVVSADEAFKAGYFKNNQVYNIVVNEGETLIIGIKTLQLIKNQWVVWDNFTLTYLGEPGIGIYYNSISDLEKKLNAYFNEGVIPSGTYMDVENVLNYKNEHGTSSDIDELQIVIDSMTHVLEKAELAAEEMKKLNSLIEEAESYLDLHYPGETQLLEKQDISIDLMQSDATMPDGGWVYAPELADAIATLKTAIWKYRLTQPATEEGVDFTWVMQSPAFTKEGGDPAISGDASSKGWVHANNPATSSQYRLGVVNGKNCWNNFNTNFVSMNVYQDLEGMPAGFYSFSCYQTNDGPSITDQHAYISAVGGSDDSPTATYTFALDNNPEKGTFAANAIWEGPLATGRVLVGTDGKLRVGFASTGGEESSGWFCFTDCKLTYHGMKEGAYTEAMQTKIAEAKKLQNKDILKGDADVLRTKIEAAEAVDATNNELAQAGLEALDQAMVIANTAIETLKAFTKGTFSNAASIAEDIEEAYPVRARNFMFGVVLNIEETLDTDTITSATLPLLTSQINDCISFLSSIEKTETVISDAHYDATARTNLEATLNTQLDLLQKDLTLIAQVKETLNYEIKLVTLSQTIGTEGVDVTLWINNPGFEETTYDTGWINEGFVKNIALADKDSDYVGNVAETWVGGGRRLADKTISQTMYVPNGRYSISVMATACQQGTLNIYEEDGITVKETVVLTMPVNGVWLFMNNDSLEIATPMIDNEGVHENQIGTNEPHSQIFTLADVEVTNHLLSFGIKTRSTTANWLAFDNFTLTCLDYTLVSTEEVDADLNTPVAYTENGVIKVVGTDQFTITTIDGIRVAKDTQLPSGIYLVEVGSQTLKVAIE